MMLRTILGTMVCRANDLINMVAEEARDKLPSLQWSTWVALNKLAFRIDPDPRPCPNCGEAGGAHIDCDYPEQGFMTKTERHKAFGHTVLG